MDLQSREGAYPRRDDQPREGVLPLTDDQPRNDDLPLVSAPTPAVEFPPVEFPLSEGERIDRELSQVMDATRGMPDLGTDFFP